MERAMMQQVTFTRMDEGTVEDYELVARDEEDLFAAFPDKVFDWLEEMDTPSPYRVTRFEHSLQAATRAHRAGEDEEMVVAALLHDVGDVLAPANHSEVAAAMLRPYVSERVYWIIKHHGLFQGYYYNHHYGRDRNARDIYKDHEWYEDTARFCAEYDQVSFDPNYESESLQFFEPMVRRVLAEPRYSL
jgi:predicted HD phosphohydrolase